MGVRKEDKDRTPLQKLKELSPSDDKAYYIRWLCMTKEEKSEYSGGFDEYSKKFMHGKTLKGIKEQQWELEEGFQKAYNYWKSLLHNKRMVELYDKMLDAGMSGDVQCAKFAKELGDSLFMSNKENKLQMIANKIKITENEEEENE